MILSKRNQLSNIHNSAQGKTKKVLCVCSAGLLRSPTLSNLVHQKYGYNTRACGTSKEYALIPITEALITWADTILFVNKENYLQLDSEELDLISERGTTVKWLNVEDDYEWNSPELVSCIEFELNKLGDV
jgi:predicted protein tyrosine phosphatase